MMKCKFELKNGCFRCQNCGYKSNNIDLDRNCDAEQYPITHFIKDLGRYVQTKFKNVSDNEYYRRLSICKSCDHYSNGKCLLCKCFMIIKARGETWKCKINKWDIKSDETEN